MQYMWRQRLVQLELVMVNMKYNALHTEQMTFYLCGAHEYVYKKIRSSIELKDYFRKTIRENK